MNRGRGRGGGGRGRRPSGPAAAKSKSGASTGKGSGTTSKSGSQNSNPPAPVVANVLTPILPPLYPTAGKPNPLDAQVSSLVHVFLELTQYYKSNYSIPLPKGKYQSAFQVARYSDRYNEPLSIDPHLIHKPDQKRLPAELMSKGITRTARKKPYAEFNMIKKLQELSNKAEAEVEEDEDVIEEIDLASDDEGKEVKQAKKEPKVPEEEEKPPGDDDEEEEEMDEELDEGTDYMADYFDNGEDYLEDEDDSVDDSAVY